MASCSWQKNGLQRRRRRDWWAEHSPAKWTPCSGALQTSETRSRVSSWHGHLSQGGYVPAVLLPWRWTCTPWRPCFSVPSLSSRKSRNTTQGLLLLIPWKGTVHPVVEPMHRFADIGDVKDRCHCMLWCCPTAHIIRPLRGSLVASFINTYVTQARLNNRGNLSQEDACSAPWLSRGDSVIKTRSGTSRVAPPRRSTRCPP